jgi:hypothetical protein
MTPSYGFRSGTLWLTSAKGLDFGLDSGSDNTKSMIDKGLIVGGLAVLVALCAGVNPAAAAEDPLNVPILVARTDFPAEPDEIAELTAPPGPSPEAVLAASYGCAEVLKVATQLTVAPNVYEKVQPHEQEKPPLTPVRKLRLAMVNVIDPFNLFAASGDASFSTWTSSSKSTYGTGWMAFGKRFGTDMTDELSGEFFQTFVFPSIFGQDPHYHRDEGERTPARIRYALTQVFITRSDSGRKIFNFGETLGNIAAASLGNVYHPDQGKGFGPTSARIAVSIASDAAWNLFTEFWPDVAKHINFRMVLLQRLADRAARPN